MYHVICLYTGIHTHTHTHTHIHTHTHTHTYTHTYIYIGEMESVVEPDVVQVAPQSGAENSANLTLTALTIEQVIKSLIQN